jgi:hypothetical protein
MHVHCYQDLALRTKAKAAEFIWRASPSLGPDAQVFAGLTGEYGGNYGPPSGFNWDVNAAATCGKRPLGSGTALSPPSPPPPSPPPPCGWQCWLWVALLTIEERPSSRSGPR